MKTERNIFIAFILNLGFSVFEFIGGLITGSVAILSDSIHDLGDAASIGISFFLEKKSKKQPDETHSYGYARYSVLGGLITTVILLFGSLAMIAGAVSRFFSPAEIDYNGMILFAIVGVLVNFSAAFFTREKGSINQKAVNLHMLEDVLGWAIVLLGAIIMRFTDFSLLDPIMSVAVSLFILYNAFGNLKEIADLFLQKVPEGIEICEIREHLLEIDGVLDAHHIHIWSTDGQSHYATLHVVTDFDPHEIKEEVKKELKEHGIGHVTVEIETSGEECHEIECKTEVVSHSGCHHHHHHGHHHEHVHKEKGHHHDHHHEHEGCHHHCKHEH